ncbi:MAG: hypothetical protein K0R34_949 [Herbinix sp.]|nr:hypothetical protein [Herbinix sp.]
MDRLKVFDRALFARQIGGISTIVILDVICLIFSPFYGRMRFVTVGGIFLFINMLNTCILYQNFLLSRGEDGFELNTEKIVYYPTTRQRFLINKYSKTLLLLIIQLLLSNVCLGFGNLSTRGEMNDSRFYGVNLIVLVGILTTSGAAILVMHLIALGIYLPMLLFYPLHLLAKWLEHIYYQLQPTVFTELTLTISVAAIAFILWLILLPIGVKIYEKVN